MHDELRTLLNATLDGELHGWRMKEMETHLVSCETCRNELEELRQISDLIRTDLAPKFLPVDRFVSQLTLKLPRHPERDLNPKSASQAWWLVPVSLLGAWFFVQTVFTLTSIVSVAKMAGLLGQVSSWVGAGQETIWFSIATSLLRGQVSISQPMLSWLNNVSVFGADLMSGFLWQAVIVLLYWSWILFWWLRQSRRL
jgi:anti-sigma factor RsiW